MVTVHLVRHGQKMATRPDPHLTEVGHQQAQLTGQFLKSKPIERIIASPMTRTQQTAGHIAKALGLPVELDHRLKERMDYENYLQQSHAEFIDDWHKASQDPTYQPLFGDSSLVTSQRIKQVIDELVPQSAGHVALITHGGAIADFLKLIFDFDDVVSRVPTHIVSGADIAIQECSVTTIIRDDKGFSWVECHYTEHLTPTDL